jgi:peptidoglycan biosynthesis protein MviN/MurJ (putative lipid II flippase)
MFDVALALVIAAGCAALVAAFWLRRRPGYRPSRLVTAALCVLSAGALAVCILGVAAAVNDGSPAQQGNPWTSLGVAIATFVAIVGGAVLAWTLAILAIRLWPRRAGSLRRS